MFMTCWAKLLVTAWTTENANVKITYLQAVCIAMRIAALHSSSSVFIDISFQIEAMAFWGEGTQD
jgi:hypothetical protein